MTDITVLNADGDRIAVALPLEPGRAAAAASKPIALSTEDLAAVNAITAALGTNHADLAQLHTDNSSTRPVSMADASNVTFGAKADAKSTATDATPITAMQVWKQISASVQLMVFGAGTAAAAQRTTLASDDPAVATLGATGDAAVTAGATGSLSAKLRAISRDIVSNIVLAAGSNLIGKVGIDQTTPGTTNAVAVASAAGTRVETTVATGGTAANLFGATPTNGFEVINPHATETLYIRENGTATAADNSISIPIPPKAAYTTPAGYKPTGDVSYIAATTGHAVIARRW